MLFRSEGVVLGATVDMKLKCRILRSQIWEKVHMCVIAEALPKRGLPALPYKQVRKRLRELQKIWERANKLTKLTGARVKKDERGSLFITIPDSQYVQHIRVSTLEIPL